MQPFRFNQPLALTLLGTIAVAAWAFIPTDNAASPRFDPLTRDAHFGPDTDSIQRIQAKIRIADEVAAGRLTLLEAARRYRPIQESAPGGLRYLLHKYPGATEQEVLCRNVITFARGTPSLQPERAIVVARLEAELAEYLACQDRP
jgi:hypothetical protein